MTSSPVQVEALQQLMADQVAALQQQLGAPATGTECAVTVTTATDTVVGTVVAE